MSTDILTQLQTCYDQLCVQFFSTVSYNARRHPLVGPDPDPRDPFTKTPRDAIIAGGRHNYVQYKLGPEDAGADSIDLQPQSPEVFDQAQQDLAEDLVVKAQQIEYLIRRLPGLVQGEEEQNAEIRRLVEEVKEMEVQRKEKRKEMRQCLEQLDNVVMGMARSIDTANGHPKQHSSDTKGE